MVNFLLVVLLMQSAQVTLGADTQPTCATKDGKPEGSCVVPEEDSADSTNLLQTNADVKRHKYQAHDKAKEEQRLHDLVAIVSKLDAKEVFKSVDADNSGDLDESEIQALGKNDPMVVGLFKSQFPILEDPNWWRESGFDADKDGRLSKDEFMTAAKEVSSFLQTAEKSMASQKMEQRMASDTMDAEAKSIPKKLGSDTKGQMAGLLEDADEEEDVEVASDMDLALKRKEPWTEDTCGGMDHCGNSGLPDCPKGFMFCQRAFHCVCTGNCENTCEGPFFCSRSCKGEILR